MRLSFAVVALLTSGCGLVFDLDPADLSSRDGGGMDAAARRDGSLADGATADARRADGAAGDARVSIDATLPDGRMCFLEICNGEDDNCDGQADEGFDLTIDPSNCGRCGMVCPGAPFATPHCADGACTFVCDSTHRDCNLLEGDGCETSITTIEHCGACNVPCALGQVCLGLTCTTDPGCDGTRDCNGDPLDGCEADLDFDPNNCGGCGIQCRGQQSACCCGCNTPEYCAMTPC